MTERYLFIDFDGVINALSAHGADGAWGSSQHATLQGYSITYAPHLIGAIEQMAAEGVHVVWLTTWCELSADFVQLGFAEHPYLGKRERVRYDGTWWKWPELQKFLRDIPQDARIGWCDDDLDEATRYVPAIEEFRSRPNVLGISPYSLVGLEPGNIASLREHFGLESRVPAWAV